MMTKNLEKKRAANKIWRLNNPEKAKASVLKWKQRNPEKAKEYAREGTKRWRARNPEVDKAFRKANPNKIKDWIKSNSEKHKKTQREYKANKRKTDPIFKAAEATRSLVNGAIKLKEYKKKSKTEVILGCSIPYFKKYMESKFRPGMTWLNHGDWHIDHIIPMASANSEAEVLRLNHYTNLQPLWAEENLAKKNKISVKYNNFNVVDSLV